MSVVQRIYSESTRGRLSPHWVAGTVQTAVRTVCTYYCRDGFGRHSVGTSRLGSWLPVALVRRPFLLTVRRRQNVLGHAYIYVRTDHIACECTVSPYCTVLLLRTRRRRVAVVAWMVVPLVNIVSTVGKQRFSLHS